ncbi:MAG: DUF692 domain-containing protein [Planctomycetes bacterium]|nr:DUF692 domain-containing protein [Planctomycetota bacterium]
MTQQPSQTTRWHLPDLGFGVGLRAKHQDALRASSTGIDFLELLSENYLDPSRHSAQHAEELATRFPMVLHGVSLSIGSCDPLDRDYLRRLRELASRMRATVVSDHLCWTGIGGQSTHDLLPVPYDEATLRYLVQRVRQASDLLDRPLVLENPSSYIAYRESSIPEHEFLARLAEESDCGILVDVNNVYVSAVNHGFDPETYLDAMPAERIVQIHLAGHRDRGTHLLDTHDQAVAPEVWALYRRLISRIGRRSTLLEWDAEIPPLATLIRELDHARALAASAAEERHVRVA